MRVTAALERFKTTKRKRLQMPSAPGLLLVIVTSLLLVACGSGGKRVYRDANTGLQLEYPAAFQARSFASNRGVVELPGTSSYRGVIVVNKAGRGVFGSGVSRGIFVWADLTPDAVVFVLTDHDFFSGIVTPEGRWPAARFPLQAASFKSFKEEESINNAYWRGRYFWADGTNYLAEVYAGPRASKADRAAIWRVVSSFRFRPSHAAQTMKR